MNRLTSMKVGGPASVFYEPLSEDELIRCVCDLNKTGVPYLIFGNGTNVIIRDKGYFGVVISTLRALRGLKTLSDPDGPRTGILCGAGESLAKVCSFTAEYGLSGLEALSGIPGTVGGAVYMNAGAYESEISDVITSVRVFDVFDGKIIMLTKSESEFSYRSSIFKKRPMIVLSVELSLEPGKKEEVEIKMADFRRKRNEKQPVDLPSSGSFFKRPEGHFAGKLIEEAGLKGMCAGGAKISEKHAGFIINTGKATAGDVLELAEKVKAIVYEKFQVKLEEEPIVIGN